MSRSILILAGAAALAAGIVVSSRGVAAPTASSTLPTATPAGQTALWGHIASLSTKGGRFELRFDPGLLLRGATAERAALEDTGSKDVPNDAYVLEESHRLLLYVVPASARVTVLTRHGVGAIPVTSITVSELAQIVKGRNPKHRQLVEPQAGFWIRVAAKYPNPVLSLDQQYQP